MTDYWIVAPEEDGQRLDKYLAAAGRLGSRARALAALERGKIFVNGAEAQRESAGARLGAGDTIRLWMDRPGSASARPRQPDARALQVIFEDDALVVVDKPAGLLTVPPEGEGSAPSAAGVLRDRPGERRHVFVVHRIDRDTSGLVLFARDLGAQAALKEQFKRRTAERVYRAVVYGRPDPREGTWRDRLTWDPRAQVQKATHPADPRGSDAVSRYRVLETYAAASLVEVTLHTGRRNQIRLQARLRGHTLVGERRYVYGPDELRPIQFPRPALHAWRLGFRHPSDGRPLTFEAPLPADFQSLLGRLRGEPPP